MAVKKTCVAIVVCTVCSALAAVVVPYAPYDESDEHHEHHQHQQHHQHDESSYSFEYAVHDPATGDAKSHREASDGRGAVSGAYSLVEPDGYTRLVEYTADDARGFVAVVKRIAPQHKAAHDDDLLEREPHDDDARVSPGVTV